MQTDALSELIGWIEQESPTRDAGLVNLMGDLVAKSAVALGLAVERIPGRDGLGDFLVVRAGPANRLPATIFLGHTDTVHPAGSVATAMPVRKEGDRLYGPGSYDMKAGLWIALHGLAEASSRGTLHRPVQFIISPDEEIGSPFSGPIIRDLAAGARCALVFEPARKGGACVTARKGVARMEIEVQGVASHSGVRHEDGRSAIAEAARHVLAIEALTDYEKGVTASVGLIRGGTTPNTIPASCHLSVDLRAVTIADAEAAVEAIRSLAPVGPDITLHITGGISRPPFERSAKGVDLLRLAQSIAAQHGIALEEAPRTGGGSDGNFTAALGVPTLDALGVEGDGAHTPGEYALISSVAPRQAFVTALLEAL